MTMLTHPDRNSAAEDKEAVMAKSAKKTKLPARLDPATRIVVNRGAEVPEFREGTAVAKRVHAVLGNGTVALALKKGARPSTVRFLAKAKVIRLVTK